MENYCLFLDRSAHMCIEHFQKLLDKAGNRQVEPNNDPRKLRPGEIDQIRSQNQQGQAPYI